MGIVFQSIYAWALPLMDGIETLFSELGQAAASFLPEGAIQSLVVDGVIAGVGSVVVFLPQIAILFFFLAAAIAISIKNVVIRLRLQLEACSLIPGKHQL